MIKERVYGKEHQEIANVLMYLGDLLSDFGNFAQARELHERALTIMERVYGRDHQFVAEVLASFGHTCSKLEGF